MVILCHQHRALNLKDDFSHSNHKQLYDRRLALLWRHQSGALNLKAGSPAAFLCLVADLKLASLWRYLCYAYLYADMTS